MCTLIVQKARIRGSGKGANGWFGLQEVSVSYDHPFHAPMEYALNIDFMNQAEGLGARVAVELTAESARALVQAVQSALARAEAEGAHRDSQGLAA